MFDKLIKNIKQRILIWALDQDLMDYDQLYIKGVK